MKYSAVLLALAVGAFAMPQEASQITSAPSASQTPNLTPQVSCALACDPADVTCQAACLGAARPNSSQAVATNECAAKCDQGDGTPEATDKFSQCVQSCIASLFPSSQTVNIPGGASGTGAAATGSNAPTGSAASGSSRPTGSSTESGANPAESTGAAASNNIQAVGAGLAGLLAIFAL
jgi:hypothetical protein